MDMVETDALIDIILGILALLVPIVIAIVGARKKPLQVTFYTHNDRPDTVLLIRNTGDRTVFVDEVILRKTYWIEYYITGRFHPNFVKSIPIHPGESIETTFSEAELIDILDQAKEKGNVDRPNHFQYRLAFKIIIESSEGTGITRWFKIGMQHGTGSCKFYSFSDYHKSFYHVRTKHNGTIPCVILSASFLVMGIVVKSEGVQAGWILTLIGYALALCAIMSFVSNGLPNRRAVALAITGTLLFSLIVFWFTTEDIIMMKMLFFVAILYIPSISKYSGWNL